MRLSEFSVRRPVTITMIFIGIALLGIISVVRLPQELFPSIVYPRLTVVTTYANAAPEEVETLITKVVEEAISTVRNLKGIQSSSREGISMVTGAFLFLILPLTVTLAPFGTVSIVSLHFVGRGWTSVGMTTGASSATSLVG